MMNSTSNEHEGSENDGIDRLSELSDEILVHILSFLPILDAVRTVCIRRFGNLWTLLPSLVFKVCHYPEYIPCSANFVRNVLILHKRVFLDKFKLSFDVDDDDDDDDDDDESLFNDITTWIGFALDRQVKELILKADIDALPRGVFTSQSLDTLCLDHCQIDKLHQVEMKSLRVLSLNSVKVTDEVMKKIISGSPSLQIMYLNGVIGLNELRFTAPNIEELHLTCYRGLLDSPNLKILKIKSDKPYDATTHPELVDVSSVSEVCIRLNDNLDIFYDYLKKFSNAEVFNFSDMKFKLSKLWKRDFPQTRWKRLHIESRLVGDQFLGICNVLRSSPHLEELVVYCQCTYSGFSDKTHDANMLSLELPSCLRQQLKTVTMRGYEIPHHGLLRLAEYLLKHTITLEEMVILPSKIKSAAVVDVLKFVKQLSSFPRASTNARVIVGSERWTIMQDQDPEVLRWQC